MNKKNSDLQFDRTSSSISAGTVHCDLFAAQALIYNQSGFKCSELRMELESTEYGAYEFELNGFSVRFRVAKTTPTKVGQFVTLWKRVENGTIQPFDASDKIDFFIISTRNGESFGQFIFPKSALCERDIISKGGKGGKRAIRVYPPWVKTESRQAQKTQSWQLKYFLVIPQSGAIDYVRAQMLYFGR